MKITSTFPRSFNLDADSINVKDITVAPSEKTRIHNHHDRECWSVVRGEGVVFSCGRQATIRAGDHIEFMPFEEHTVENRGSEDLCFTTHWYPDWDAIFTDEESFPIADKHTLIETAFPTPNGPLHLGHLSGAYLLSDVFKRCCQLTGIDSFSYCGTYGHTNHIDKTAAARGTTYADLVKRSEDVIVKDLERFQAEYDEFLHHAPGAASFESTKSTFIDRVLASEYLVERTVEHPFSESAGRFICESYVSGLCPHCGAATIGMECESCGLYQDECDLVDPVHSVTKEKLTRRSVNRLYLRVDRDILRKISVQIYNDNTSASRTCYERLQRYVSDGALVHVPVSSLRGKGVPLKDEQVLTVVMERALRSFHGLAQYPSAARHLFFCGTDNLCGSGILMPYVLKVLGVPDPKLPVAVINQFCLLENKKFSTGANHAIWADEFLQTYPSDLVRLYLAQIHSPANESNFRIDAFFEFSNTFVNALIEVFAEGQALLAHFTTNRIEAGPWLKQDIAFYRELHAAGRRCLEGYVTHEPRVAVRQIRHLLETISDYIAQGNALRNDRDVLRTKLALMFHAYQCLAYCLYPVMPTSAAQIMDDLGADRTQWYSNRRAVRIVEYATADIGAVVRYLSEMKRGVQH